MHRRHAPLLRIGNQHRQAVGGIDRDRPGAQSDNPVGLAAFRRHVGFVIHHRGAVALTAVSDIVGRRFACGLKGIVNPLQRIKQGRAYADSHMNLL